MSAKKAAQRALCLSGEQTVRTITEAHNMLRAALDASNTVVLDTSYIEIADLSVVQLIESARLTAASLGKTICLKTPLSAALTEQLERGGFLGAPASFWKTP